MFVQVVTAFYYNMGVIIFAVGQEIAFYCSFSYQGFNFSSCVIASYSSPFKKKLSFYGVFTTIRHVYTMYITSTILLFFKMLVQLFNDLKVVI